MAPSVASRRSQGVLKAFPTRSRSNTLIARIESTVTTTEPFHLTPYYDHEPVIHRAFQPLFDPAWAGLATSPWPSERFIRIDNTASERTWNCTPDDSGPEEYYETSTWDDNGAIYFRHERKTLSSRRCCASGVT